MPRLIHWKRNFAPQVKRRRSASSKFIHQHTRMVGLFNTAVVSSKEKRRGRRNERQMLLRRNEKDTMRLHDERQNGVF
tara:strand:- start:1118 stop:1351 length:234 start_codon:yes stop_codon:yes gene_type:complete